MSHGLINKVILCCIPQSSICGSSTQARSSDQIVNESWWHHAHEVRGRWLRGWPVVINKQAAADGRSHASWTGKKILITVPALRWAAAGRMCSAKRSNSAAHRLFRNLQTWRWRWWFWCLLLNAESCGHSEGRSHTGSGVESSTDVTLYYLFISLFIYLFPLWRGSLCPPADLQ